MDTDLDASEIFVKGARVKLSPKGYIRHPVYDGRQATVVGGCVNPSSFRLIWDGAKSPCTMHKDYLEIIHRP
jgi:hypothetical protein